MFLNKTKEVSTMIEEFVDVTPLTRSTFLSKKYESNILLKCENLQTIGAFKIRGAASKILTELKNNPKLKTVYTASSGNHASGVASVCEKLGLHANIYVPLSTPEFKKEKVRGYGANLVVYGKSYDEAYKRSVEACKLEDNSVFIHPFDDDDVRLGNATIGLELQQQCKDADLIVCPVGGGGLISGIAQYTKLVNPSCKVIGVEPINNPSMYKSKQNGEVCVVEHQLTFADGVNVLEVANTNLRLVEKFVDDIVLVSEEEIKQSVVDLLSKQKLLVEGAGALSVAGLSKVDVSKYKNVVCVLSGGNIDLEKLKGLM